MQKRRALTLFVALGLMGQGALAAVSATAFPAPAVLVAVALLLVLTTQYLLRRFRDDVPRSAWSRHAGFALFAYWAACVLALPGLVLVALTHASQTLPSYMDAFGWCLLVYAGALLLAIWGIWVCRRWVRVTHLVLQWPELPEAFDGFTVAHLSDLHIGSTDSKAEADRWVALTNRCRPDSVFVTGDLVTHGTAFYPAVCDALAGLRAPAGVFVVLGNHDLDAPEVLRADLKARGIELLRNAHHTMKRETAELAIIGLDPCQVNDTVIRELFAKTPDGVFTVLLSHYPHAFEMAAAHGVQLVLSGHTHGGQVGLPWFGDAVNFASLSGQRGRGLVEQASAKLFVSAGLGTTGLPIRLGVRPEIALLEFRTQRRSAR